MSTIALDTTKPEIGFFTAVSYERKKDASLTELFLECADDCFFFGGEKAVVILNTTPQDGVEKVILEKKENSWIAIAFKVLAIVTVVPALFLLLAKAALRYNRTFQIIQQPNPATPTPSSAAASSSSTTATPAAASRPTAPDILTKMRDRGIDLNKAHKYSTILDSGTIYMRHAVHFICRKIVKAEDNGNQELILRTSGYRANDEDYQLVIMCSMQEGLPRTTDDRGMRIHWLSFILDVLKEEKFIHSYSQPSYDTYKIQITDPLA